MSTHTHILPLLTAISVEAPQDLLLGEEGQTCHFRPRPHSSSPPRRYVSQSLSEKKGREGERKGKRRPLNGRREVGTGKGGLNKLTGLLLPRAPTPPAFISEIKFWALLPSPSPPSSFPPFPGKISRDCLFPGKACLLLLLLIQGSVSLPTKQRSKQLSGKLQTHKIREFLLFLPLPPPLPEREPGPTLLPTTPPPPPPL